jgi:hypothetical protein
MCVFESKGWLLTYRSVCYFGEGLCVSEVGVWIFGMLICSTCIHRKEQERWYDFRAEQWQPKNKYILLGETIKLSTEQVNGHLFSLTEGT